MAVKVALGVVGAAVTFKTSGYLFRRYVFIPNMTILADLPNLGKPRKDGKKIHGRAVICGGSVAGLLAAAVCADHFDSVLIIEPEAWTNDGRNGTVIPEKHELRTAADGYPAPISRRTRVPQYLVNHFLQPPVYMGMKQLFPNLKTALDDIGSAPIVLRARFQYGGVYVEDPYTYTTTDINSGAPLTLPLSREALETILRRLVRSSRPNIEFRTGTVTGFKRAQHDAEKLSGVTLRTDGAAAEESGELIIDATGANHLAFSKWLESAGFPVSPSLKDEYDPQMSYSTSVWTIPSHLHNKWPVPWGYETGTIFGMQPDPHTGEQRVLFLGIVEKDQLLITTGGWGSPEAPHSIQGIRDYAKSLASSDLIQPWVFEVFNLLEAHEEECGPFYADAKPGALDYLKYHEAKLPTNFVAVGDAVMKLNPVYGQGVTKAIMDATTLDGILRQTPSSPKAEPRYSSIFFQKLCGREGGLWDGTKAVDYGFSSTIPAKGEDLEHGAGLRNYGYATMMLARTDPDVHSTWWHVNMQLAPATDFFAPWLLRRMAWRWLMG